MRIDRSPREPDTVPVACNGSRHLSLSVLAVVAALLVVWTLPGMRGAVDRSHAAGSPSLVASPTSGLPLTTVSLSGLYFPREADLATDTVTFTFDSTSLTRPTIASCSANTAAGFGFGTQCTGQSYQYQIPSGTSAGTHTFHLVVTEASGVTRGQTLVDVSATFSLFVLTFNTPTNTATMPVSTSTATVVPTSTTMVPTSTSTVGATATSTIVAATPSATATQSPTALPSTATATQTVAAATPTAGASTSTQLPPTAAATPKTKVATVTPSPTPAHKTSKAAPLVVGVMIRPEFGSGTVLVAYYAAAGTSVRVGVAIRAALSHGHSRTVFSATRTGKTGTRGFYACVVKLSVPANTVGSASVTIQASGPGGIRKLSRVYRYRGPR